jgi:hypothetical protein
MWMEMSGWLGMKTPLPDKDVSLPSNVSDLLRSSVSAPQFQYLGLEEEVSAIRLGNNEATHGKSPV